MFNKAVEIALKYKGLIVMAVIAVIAGGIYQYNRMPVDAFPDISPVMVPVFAEAHGLAPEEVERLITYPIESVMNGLPGVTQIKSTSAFGMAVIYVYFKDSVDIYFARQLVGERLAAAMADLPEMEEPPTLGPISTGLGQIFIYYLTLDEGADTEGKEPDTYLREVNDWIVKFQLQTVPGVTDILSVGGHVLQYQVQVDPRALVKYELSLEDLVEAIHRNNHNAGGQFLVLGSEEYLVRGLGLLEDLDDIRSIPVLVENGVVVKMSDLANVAYGNEIRRGVVTRNGEREVVSGMVLKLYGENTSEVIERLYQKIETTQASLPEGVTLVPYYEQAELVARATNTVKHALAIGAFLVVLTLFVFLGNFRTAFIVALSLPLCALVSVIFMNQYGISANLMSLGGIAIAIGMLGDGATVMVENIHRKLTDGSNADTDRMIILHEATKEVANPIAFSIGIILVVFLPIFTLEGVEGKMFAPMAFTLAFALFGSLLTALFVAPVLSAYLLKKEKKGEPRLIHALKAIYKPLLKPALRFNKMLCLLMLIALVLSLLLMNQLGTEFIPTLEEGSILIGVAMAPSISLEKATETIMAMERKIREFPEIEETVSRIGRPEAGSHPHPVNYAEVHLELHPMEQWTRFDTKAELIEALNHHLESVPGVQLNFTQPIQNAFDELLSGIKAQLAVKVFGEDLNVLRKKADEIVAAVQGIPGLVDLSAEQSYGQPQVQVIPNREACARFGIDIHEIQELVELAVGGEVVDTLFKNTRRYGIHVRFQEYARRNTEDLRNMLAHNEDGALIPLSQVAEVKEVVGPIQVNRENNQRRWIVQGNVRGRDLGGVVADMEARIREKVEFPPGYYIEFGGQFENQRRAMTRLGIIAPIVILGVFLMLWMAFGSARHAAVIFTAVPLALIGGILGLFVMGEYLSVPASVGFIALFGIAVQNGMILVSFFNELRFQGDSIEETIIEGCMLRMRPVLMTAVTTVLGLLPLLLSTGTGAEVQRPLAVVVIFGLISSTLLTLFVIPAVYKWVEKDKGSVRSILKRK